MENEEKDLVKKLLHDALSFQEKEDLLSRAPVDRHLRRQWEGGAPDFARTEKVDGSRIWRRIDRIVWRTVPAGRVRFVRWCRIAAAVLLLAALGGAAGYRWSRNEVEMRYIASSGVRHTESITLPDGSIVQLGAGSRLTYPGRFTGGERRVELSGQAFFEVAKDKTKPFIVHMTDMDVTVLGTAFEVFSSERETQAETILLNGRVRVDVAGEDGSSAGGPVYLSPDEKLTFDKTARQVRVEKVDADKYTAWRIDGTLRFENEKLSVILPRLERWYGCRIDCPRAVAEKYRFTFQVHDESPERLLYMFSQSAPLTYRKNGNRYEIVVND